MKGEGVGWRMLTKGRGVATCLSVCTGGEVVRREVPILVAAMIRLIQAAVNFKLLEC